MNPRAIGLIPSRWGSTRFPGKSLASIGGKPLLAWVVERVRQSRRLEDVVVATDDDRIAGAARSLGVRAVLTRPDHPSGTDRIAEAMRGLDANVIVNIQGDEPLIAPELIDELAVKMATEPDWAMATAACPIKDVAELASPHVVKVVLDSHDGALYFSRLPIPCRRDGPPDLTTELYWRHLGIYAYRGALLNRLVAEPPCPLEQSEMLEQLRALYLGAKIAVIRTNPSGIGVDTPQDVVYLEAELQRRMSAAQL